MKFTTAVSIFAAAGSAVAAPKPASYSKQAFRIMTLRTASPIHFGATQASKGNVYVNLRDQGATCDKPTTEAYYSLEYDSLYLYNESAQKQLVYVDRSITGMFLTRSSSLSLHRRISNHLQTKDRSATSQRARTPLPSGLSFAAGRSTLTTSSSSRAAT